MNRSEALDRATPAGRDRYVDFLRAASLGVVVLGHWLMAAVGYHGGRLSAMNVLRVDTGAQVLTWGLQVMPLFFFVGGFSNAASWSAATRDGTSYAGWLGARVGRLVRPALAFAVLWAAFAAGARAVGVTGKSLHTAEHLVALPLWFLAVYLLLVAAAPAMLAAHRRLGWWVPAVLALGTATVDVARWGFDVHAVGWANFALVWLLAHQLGFLWRDGRLTSSRRAPWLLAGAGLAALVALTGLAGYPVSLVGGVGEARTNTDPPSLALVAAALFQVGVVLAVRGPVDRWLHRPRAWAAVVGANAVAMTTYLWHLTALVVLSAVVLPAGLFPQPRPGSAGWWALRPAWVALLVLTLVPIVAVMARAERRRPNAAAGLRGPNAAAGLRGPNAAAGLRGPNAAAAAAAAAGAAGMAALALGGFSAPGMPFGLPVVGPALLVAAVVGARRTNRTSRPRRSDPKENPVTANVASLLADSAARFPHRPAMVLGDRTLDYASLDDCARRFAGGLGDLGIRAGEHVALLVPNVPQFSVAYFGCHYAAVPVVPLNVLLSTDEIEYQLADSDAVALVVWEGFYDRAAAAAARVPGCRRLVVARADLGDLSAPAGASNLTAVVLGATPVGAVPDTSTDDTAVVIYSSGTTGRPKGAELTHGNLCSNAVTCATQVFPIDPETVALVALPLFHAFGQTVMHNAVLATGGTVVLMPRWDPAAAVELVRAHRVDFFGGVPTMYVQLLRQADAATPALGSLRICVSGGAPLPASVMDAFHRRFGLALLEGYGLSETSPVVAFNAAGGRARPGSVGPPVPGVEARLVDEAGRAVSDPDTPGELWVRGPNVMKGYYGNPAATAEVLDHGWFRTGDIATRDADGAYRIVDRCKDMIVRGGYKVYPREVEDVLVAHPAVVEAAVVGVPDDELGEEVVAFVTVDPDVAPTDGELLDWARDRLAAYKYPRRVEILDSLPHGPTGKVLKRRLRSGPAALTSVRR